MKLNDFEFISGTASAGWAYGAHTAYASNPLKQYPKVAEEFAKVIAELGVDSLENAKKVFGLGPYPYLEVIGLTIVASILISDSLIRRYRGEGLLESVYYQLKKIPHYVMKKPHIGRSSVDGF